VTTPTPHPPPELLARYRTLRGRELLDLDDHLAGCASCRELAVRPFGDVSARALESIAGAHVEYETLERYAEETLDAAEREEVEQHLAVCERCADEARDLATFAAPRVRPKRWWIPAAAAAILIAGLSLYIARPRQIEQPPSPPVSSTRIETANAIVDGNRSYVVDASGAIAGLPDDLRAVADTLRAGGVPAGEMLRLLAGHAGQERGPERDGERPEVVEPVGMVIEDTRPLFRWRGANRATVEVFDREQRLVASSGGAGNSWRAETPLPRGETYAWQVVITGTDGQRVAAPAPPLPPARFRIVGEDAARALAAARAGGAHLTAGLVCAREGLLDCAATELEAAARANPRSPAAAQLAAAAKAAETTGRTR